MFCKTKFSNKLSKIIVIYLKVKLLLWSVVSRLLVEFFFCSLRDLIAIMFGFYIVWYWCWYFYINIKFVILLKFIGNYGNDDICFVHRQKHISNRAFASQPYLQHLVGGLCRLSHCITKEKNLLIQIGFRFYSNINATFPELN